MPSSAIWRDSNYFDGQYFQNHLVSDVFGLVAIGLATGAAFLELHHLVGMAAAGRLDDLQVFGDPDEAQCTTAGGTLNCTLAPSTSVRVLWGGWEGGFRVNPRGVTLTANGDGLQCGGG